MTKLAMIASLVLAIFNPLSVNAAIPHIPRTDYASVNGSVYDIVTASDGSAYIAGSFDAVNGEPDGCCVARILPNGQRDPNFHAEVDNNISVLALSPDESVLYIGGNFNTINGQSRRNFGSIDADSGTITAFDPSILGGEVHDIAIADDGTVAYAVGGFNIANFSTSFVGRDFIAAFNTSNGIVTDFDPGLSAQGWDIELDDGADMLYAGGQLNNTSTGRVTAINTTTGIATAYNPNISGGNVRTMELDTNNDLLYIGGDFTTVNGGTTRNCLAALSTINGVATSFNPNVGGCGSEGRVRDIAIDTVNETLFFGGTFTTINGGATRNRIAEVSLTTGIATAFDPNADSTVEVIRVADNSDSLYVGGQFSTIANESLSRLALFQNSDYDLDNDSIPNTIEHAAPNNGDANNDSILDSQQANVTSLVNSDTNEYVTVSTPLGTTLSTTTAIAAPEEVDYTHLFGLTGFTVNGVTPGGIVDVNIFYPNPNNYDPAGFTARKYFPATTSYQTITGATITATTIDSQPVIQFAYQLTDGGIYDLDSTVDGTITDPVSLAVLGANTTPPTLQSDGAGLANTGQDASLIFVTATLFLAMGLYKYRRVHA